MAMLDVPVALPTRRRALGLGAGTALALGAASPLLAQAPGPPRQDEEPVEGFRLFENLLTRMAVEVGVGGGRKALFVIDTGAERTALSARLTQRIGLAPGPPVLIHGITASELAATAILPRLEVEDRSFSQLVLPVFADDLIGADGLLGLDILSQYRLTLDLRGRRVMIAPSGPDVIERGIAFGRASRIRNDVSRIHRGRFGQLFMTQLEVGGVPAVGFVDSGAQYSIANLALMRAMDRQVPAASHGQVRVYGVTGQSLVARTGSAPSLRVARWNLGPTPLLFADLHAFSVLNLNHRPALLLGADIIGRFSRITLDYGRSELRFGTLMHSS